MKVLFVSSMALFAGTRYGGAKRLYYLAKGLEEQVDLRVLSFDGSRELQGGAPFRGSFRRHLQLPMRPLPRGLSRLAFLPGVADVVSDHRDEIATFLGDSPFDAVIIAFPIALAFLERPWPVSLGRRFYIEDDLLIEQYRKAAEGGRGFERLSGWLRWRQCRSFFARHRVRLARFICISREEEAMVHGYFPGLPTGILAYGLPLAEFPFLDGRVQDPMVLGFIGNFGHTPNLDALQWLLGEIFPRLKEREPRARLIVAGRSFPGSLKPLCASDAGVTFMEDVENLEDFYSRIGVFINPIRKGRGLRTKVVEAAAFGRPILSTRLGAEGLDALRIGICETTGEFLAALSALYGGVVCDEEVRLNRVAVEKEFSVESQVGKMMRMLEESPSAGI